MIIKLTNAMDPHKTGTIAIVKNMPIADKNIILENIVAFSSFVPFFIISFSILLAAPNVL